MNLPPYTMTEMNSVCVNSMIAKEWTNLTLPDDTSPGATANDTCPCRLAACCKSRCKSPMNLKTQDRLVLTGPPIQTADHSVEVTYQFSNMKFLNLTQWSGRPSEYRDSLLWLKEPHSG